MAHDGREAQDRADADGVRIESTRGFWTMVGAFALAVAVIVFVMIQLALDRPVEPAAKERRQDRKHFAAQPPAARLPRERMHVIPIRREVAQPEPTAVPTRRAEAAEPPGPTPEPKPTREPGWEAMDEPLITAEMLEPPPPPPPSDYGWKGPTGIALFPAPGTNPPKPGIIVPEDYELPPGYMRHYQTTDDGRSLEPILTFHPDYEFVDENGNRIEVPADRIVPPEMAPPDLPIKILEIPEPNYGGPSQAEMERILREHPELLSPDMSPEEAEGILRKYRGDQPSP